MQQQINSKLVKKLGSLSKVNLSESEEEKLVKDLQDTLIYVNNLSQIETNTTGDYFTSENTVTFPDSLENTRSLVLGNSDCESIKTEFIVPKVL